MKARHRQKSNKLLSRQKSKSVSRSRSKSRNNKQFDPIKYLNAVIDLPVFPQPKQKKPRHRNIHSIATGSTPVSSQILSSGKLRSRSSYSQYRKKDTMAMKDLLNINLFGVITDEDLVKFTEEYILSSLERRENVNNYDFYSNQPTKSFKVLHLTQNQAALLIQRAWKKFKTLKTIQKHYRNFAEKCPRKYHYPPEISQLKPFSLKISNIQPKHLDIGKQPLYLEQTLKIKHRPKSKQKYVDKSEIETLKNSVDRENLTDIKNLQTPFVDKNLQERQQVSNEDLIKWMKVNQTQRWLQIMELFRKQKQSQRYEQQQKQKLTIDQLSQKLQSKRQASQDDLQSHSNQYGSPMFPGSIKLGEGQNLSEGTIEKLNEIIPYSSYSVEKEKQDKFNKAKNFQFIQAEHNLMQKRMLFLHEKKQIKIAKITALNSVGKMSKRQACRQISQIQNRFNSEIRYIEKTIRQYEDSVQSISSIALKCHKDTTQRKKSGLNRLKRAFSTGCILFKQIMEQFKISSIKIQDHQVGQRFKDQSPSITHSIEKAIQSQDIKSSFNREEHNQQERKQNDMSVLRPIKEDVSESLMKKCTEDLQQVIQEFLIKELVEELYISDIIYQEIRHHVQKYGNFQKITDSELQKFIKDIKAYYPSTSELLKLCSQKINPTSQQILKIMGDGDYQLEEYELIFSQNIFKQYRQDIGHLYEEKRIQSIVNMAQIDESLSDENLYAKLLIRKAQKVSRIQKHIQFQKDLRIIYLKSVFNCLNQYMIQAISYNGFMNGRASIGPGQLSLAIRECNRPIQKQELESLINKTQNRILQTLRHKCITPNFNNVRQLQQFQQQSLYQLKLEYNQGQYRWVNYMDEVLQIWQEVSSRLFEDIIDQYISQLQMLHLKSA